MQRSIRNVRDIVFANEKNDRYWCLFRRVVFLSGKPIVLVEYEGKTYSYRVNPDTVNGSVEPVMAEDIRILKQAFPLDFSMVCEESFYKGELVLFGCSYNESRTAKHYRLQFAFSTEEQPLDLLCYLLQTGADYVRFLA
jgi:hypothetical protein